MVKFNKKDSYIDKRLTPCVVCGQICYGKRCRACHTKSHGRVGRAIAIREKKKEMKKDD